MGSGKKTNVQICAFSINAPLVKLIHAVKKRAQSAGVDILGRIARVFIKYVEDDRHLIGVLFVDDSLGVVVILIDRFNWRNVVFTLATLQ